MTFPGKDVQVAVRSSNNSNDSLNVGGTTTLGTTVDDSTTTVVLTDGSTYPSADGVILIGTEYISYTSRTSNTLNNCTRGAYDSTGAAHTSGDAVQGVWIGTSERDGYPAVMVNAKVSQTATIYLDFLPITPAADLWTTYPTAGFSLLADTPEFHTAVKGFRYFRARIINTSTSNLTGWMHIGLGQFGEGRIPINQTISSDQDSTITRSILTGSDPLGTYSNQNINGYIITESNTLADAATYDSGILDVSGYTQIAIELYADQIGDLSGIWYDDSSGTNALLTFTLPYSTASTLVTNTFPSRGRYLKWTFTNDSGSAQTVFQFNCKLTNAAFSGQTLGVENTIVSSMLSNLTRSVTTGKQPDGDYVNTPADGEAFQTSTALNTTTLNETLTSSDTSEITVISTSNFAAATAQNVKYLLIDEEFIAYDGITNGTTFSIASSGRGALGSTAVEHDNGSLVSECYVSDWVDTDGWNSIELFVKSDVASTTGGVKVQYTDDTTAGAQTIRGTTKYYYGDTDIARGFEVIKFEPYLDGYRVIYSTKETQTSFFLATTLKVNSDNLKFNEARAIETTDFFTEVALNTVANYESVTKFGRRENLVAGDDIWSYTTGTTYTGHPYPCIPETIEVASGGNIADTGALGTSFTSPSIAATNNSTKITITVSATTGLTAAGDWVRITGATGLGGNITASLLNDDHKIFNLTGTTFDIIVRDSNNIPVRANASDTLNGGTPTISPLGGTGAHSIRISGLKKFNSQEYETEDITLAGASSATSTNTWYRVNRAYVLRAGSGGSNAGVITIRHSTTTANVFASITAGYNQTTVCAYTVPYNKKALIKSIKIAIAKGGAQDVSSVILLQAREVDGVFRTLQAYDVQSSSFVDNKIGGIVLTANTDIKLRINSVSTTGVAANGTIELILLDL